jgi:hypothetical protein
VIFPILFLLGLAYVGTRMGKATPNVAPPPPRPVVSSGYGRGMRAGVGVIRVEHPAPNPKYRFRGMLRDRLISKGPVTRWLVDNAMLEAFNNGDMDTVLMLTRAFGKRKKPASEKQTASAPRDMPDTDGENEGETDEVDEVGESDGPDHSSHPDHPEGNELSELGQPSLKSPLDGVPDDDWMDFVARLRTKAPGFKSDKYLGQYEQNRKRLKQLGLTEPANSEEEYEALAKDIATHAQDSVGLINAWSGDVVKVNGADHPVCASGILGLLKYAGPEGAKSWLTNPEDRAKFPKTTEAFLRTNSCF